MRAPRWSTTLALFDRDPETDAVLLFGEPGTPNEREVAHYLRAHPDHKPVIAVLAGAFRSVIRGGPALAMRRP